jgi:signal transduction histidine kinase
VAGVFAAAHDVTEALRARAELEQKQLLLDQTARLARVGGWEIDLVRGSLSWTDMVYEIHEVERSYQPSVQTGIQFYAPEAVPVISEAVRRAIEVQEPFDLELPLVTAKGTRLWVRAIGKALIEDGVTRRVTGVFQDLTAKKKAEDELEQYRRHLEQMVTDRTADLKRSNADLEQFAYVASHDLQEPLRMVASFTQLLADEYAGKLDQKAGTYIEFAVSGARRMQGLINDLLAYSRIGSRKPPLAPVPCGQVVSEVLLGLGQAVEEAGAQVRVGPLPSVQADRAQLTQVFQNLIGNALKFRGGRAPIIDVSARPEGASWVFEVRDNGIGIDPQDFERVFVIFQRLHDRGAYPGNGIGLPLVKKIVERHGGRIWIESEPGAGSRFLFTLTSQGDAHA